MSKNSAIFAPDNASFRETQMFNHLKIERGKD